MITSKDNLTRQGEDRRQSLVLAAYRIIAEEGFEGLRVRDVAAQVGINSATLHHYFPTKEDLIRAVVEYVTQRLAATTLSLTGSPVEQMRSHLSLLFQRMQHEPALFVVLTEIGLRAQRTPEIAHSIQQQEEIWHEQLVSILQSGIRQGNWPEDLDAEAVASTIIIFLESLSLRVSSQPSRAEQALRQFERWLFSP